MPDWTPQPDYRRFIAAIRRQEPDRVPIAEMGVDPAIKELVLGRPVVDVATDARFWWQAGYDYMPLRPEYEFPRTMPGSSTTGRPDYAASPTPAPRTVRLSGPGAIAGPADLDTYPWPDPDQEAYYAPLLQAAGCLPPGMGLVSGVGGIFTRVWMLLGLEGFCYRLTEEPALIAALFERVGAIQCAVLRKVVRLPRVVAVWYGDDLAYTEATIVSPRVYRRYLFPWIEELAAIAHGAGLPFLFHSDGRLWEVLPDLIGLGVDALHPIEPKAMDINLVKARFGHRLALIGNIDMELLALGTPEQVRQQVRQRIKDLAPGGGYAVGANPGVTDYVRPENYEAMRQATLAYGTYPIRL